MDGGVYITKTMTSNLSEGRHTLTSTFNGDTNTISVYLDGVKVFSAVIAVLPTRVGWTYTTFCLTAVARSTDNYVQRFRSWAMCLTDKQVSTL